MSPAFARHFASHHYDTMRMVPHHSVHLVRLDTNPVRPAICGRKPKPTGEWCEVNGEMTCGICQLVWGQFLRTQQRLLAE